MFILILENFPVAQVLATPGQIDTLPTFIYRLMNTSPSRGNEASVIAIVLVAAVVTITLVQRRILAKRSYTTISGKGVKARTLPLGRFKTPVVAVALVYFLLAIVLPLLALFLSAIRSSPYMQSFASLTEPAALDITSFAHVFTSEVFTTAATNSVIVSLLAALGGTILAFLVGYTVYRTSSYARGLLEALSMVPLAIPAIVLGIGLLWTWLVMPIPVYGTLWVLIIGFVAVQMPQGFRGIAAAIQATDRDLEDSAVLLGARRTRAIGYVTIPPAARRGVLDLPDPAHAEHARADRAAVPLHHRHPHPLDRHLRPVRERRRTAGSVGDGPDLLRHHVPPQLPAPPIRRQERSRRCLSEPPRTPKGTPCAAPHAPVCAGGSPRPPWPPRPS